MGPRRKSFDLRHSLYTKASAIWFACHCINIGQFQTAEPHTTVQQFNTKTNHTHQFLFLQKLSKHFEHKYGPQHEKTCPPGFANNKGTDRPMHLCSLISALVICLLESIISKHASSEISIF